MDIRNHKLCNFTASDIASKWNKTFSEYLLWNAKGEASWPSFLHFEKQRNTIHHIKKCLILHILYALTTRTFPGTMSLLINSVVWWQKSGFKFMSGLIELTLLKYLLMGAYFLIVHEPWIKGLQCCNFTLHLKISAAASSFFVLNCASNLFLSSLCFKMELQKSTSGWTTRGRLCFDSCTRHYPERDGNRDQQWEGQGKVVVTHQICIIFPWV